ESAATAGQERSVSSMGWRVYAENRPRVKSGNAKFSTFAATSAGVEEGHDYPALELPFACPHPGCGHATRRRTGSDVSRRRGEDRHHAREGRCVTDERI